MADKREQIILRLMAIAATIDGIETVVRNRGLLKDEQRPAIVILDADESPASPSVTKIPSRGGIMPSLINMRPEMYYLEKEARIQNVQIGEKLNAVRMLVCAAIANDADLKALLGPNGGIIYNGAITDLKSGSALTGEMKLDFTYRYVFDPAA